MNQEDIIELNGKRYDAATGKLLGHSAANVAEPLAPPVRQRTLDGVVRAKTPHKEHHPEPHHDRTHHAKKKHPAARRQPSAPVRPHHPEPPKTLMRRAVHQPKPAPKPAMKLQGPSEVVAAHPHGLAPKPSAARVDPIRQHHAHATPQHQHVKRFHHPATATVAPAHHIALDVAPAPKPHAHKQDMFEAAIARATSHEQPEVTPPKPRKKHGRLAGTMAGLAAFLLLGGFLTYLNLPQLELKVASVRAGFSARMPGHTPTGYELADIAKSHSAITLSFRSGEQNYRITQQPSNWNSQTLQDDQIASADHETVESKGRVIYLYDGVASWVDGGVRYDITGNARLSRNDIADIAASM